MLEIAKKSHVAYTSPRVNPQTEGMSQAFFCVCVQAGVFNETGHYEESVLHAGDAGFAPVTSGHFFKNVGSTDSYVVLIFNNGQFTNIDATALIGNMPAEVCHLNDTLSIDHLSCASVCL